MDIVGHWLNVRQESCQAIGNRQKYCCGVEETRTSKQINGEGDDFCFRERFLKKGG